MITFWGLGVPGNDSSSQTCKPTNKINRSVPVRFIINNNWFYLWFSLSPVEQRGNVYLRPLKLPPLWISRPVTHTKCLSLLSDGFASHLLSFQPLRQSCHQGQRFRRSSGNFKSTWHILHLWVCVAMISPRIYPSSLCRASPEGPSTSDWPLHELQVSPGLFKMLQLHITSALSQEEQQNTAKSAQMFLLSLLSHASNSAWLQLAFLAWECVVWHS